MNKNLKLTIILISLVAITGILMFWDGDNQGNLPRISLEEGAIIQTLTISGAEKITMNNEASRWNVNSQFGMDENLSAILNALFQKIRIKRELDGAEKKEIEKLMQEKGVELSIEQTDGEKQSWKISGKPNEQKSFIMLDEEIYEIHLPGYDSYIAGLFEMKANDWRSRRIFNGTLQSLYKMKLVNATDSFSIQYQTPFYQTQGIGEFDTLAFIYKLEASVNWRFAQWEAQPDTSILNKNLTLTMEDLNPMLNATIEFYSSSADTNTVWVNVNDKEWASIGIQQFSFWNDWEREIGARKKVNN